MLSGLFENAHRKRKDARDIEHMASKYGDTMLDQLQQRANNSKLTDRERKHWARLLRKARRL